MPRWAFLETSSAAAVLRSVCPGEWADIIHVLNAFSLDPCHWLKAGRNRGDVAKEIDGMFGERGWREIRVDLTTQGVLVAKGGNEVERLDEVYQEGYLVDNFKGRVAVVLKRDMTASRNLRRSQQAPFRDNRCQSRALDLAIRWLLVLARRVQFNDFRCRSLAA